MREREREREREKKVKGIVNPRKISQTEKYKSANTKLSPSISCRAKVGEIEGYWRIQKGDIFEL